jgi:hypothetical protein
MLIASQSLIQAVRCHQASNLHGSRIAACLLQRTDLIPKVYCSPFLPLTKNRTQTNQSFAIATCKAATGVCRRKVEYLM